MAKGRTMRSFSKDSGWCWFVCVGSFFAMLLETGMVKALGLMLPVLQEQFSTNTWVIGLIISMVPGFGAIACIFGGILEKTSSPRIAMMTYGLLSSMGFMVGYLSDTMQLLVVAVLLIGFAFGAEALTIAALPLYFDKFYDLVNAIAHAGLSIGLMILPPLTQFLLDTYGWRGTFLVLGALNFNLVVCGVLLRPLQKESTSSLHKTDGNYHSINGSSFTSPQKQSIDNNMSIIHIMDLDLFFNFDFVTLFCICTAAGYFFTGWLIYFVPHCQVIGFSPRDSSFLATVGGVGNLIGTIVFPISAKYLTGKWILYISAIIAGLGFVTDIVMSVFHSYIGMMMSSFAVNFGFAVTDCCMFMELVVVVEEKKLTTAVNWLFVGYSLGSLASGFLSGWLYDRFGNYITSFLLMGVASPLSVTPWVVLDIRNALKDYHTGRVTELTPILTSTPDRTSAN